MPLTSFRVMPCRALPEPRPAEEVDKRFRSVVAELGAWPRERGPALCRDGVKDSLRPVSEQGDGGQRRSLSRNSAEVARRAMRAVASRCSPS
ncbi:hypothetical protein DIPPA_07062 [Diplonema papillatum]|nr:hypothetical protein DIPPA_07062 [Diplonema papillatum]